MRFLDRVRDYSRKQQFLVFGMAGAKMMSAYSLRLEDTVIELDDVSWKQLAVYLGFSVKSLEKASDSLKMATFDHFMEERDNSEVLVQFYDGQAEKFYRTDHPLLPVEEILFSLSSLDHEEFGNIEEFEVTSWLTRYDQIQVDIISNIASAGWTSRRYALRCGVRMKVSLDTKSSSYLETLLEFTPRNPKKDPFYVAVPLAEKMGRMAAKGETKSDLMEKFSEALLQALQCASELSGGGLQELGKGPISEAEPKIKTMLEDSKVPVSIQPKIERRITEEYTQFSRDDRLSELGAILIVGEQSPHLGKSRTKVEQYLGSLIAMGGDQVLVCGCCEQRLPTNKIKEKNNGL